MEDRLKNLKKAMDRTTFTQLNFTEQHQKEIREKISKQEEKNEDVILAIMQLLVQEKTGYELAKHLRGRGIQKFEDNEGFLYALLHRLEHNRCIQSHWDDSGAKFYQLNDKGRKLVQKAEKKQNKKQIVLKELLER